MTQRIAVVGPGKDGLALSITQFLKRPSANGIHVVPTTVSTLSAVSTWARDANTHVVGHREFFRGYGLESGSNLHTPTRFLEVCRHAHGTGEAVLAVVFTDQMVSVEFAPILVNRRGVLQFFPSLELIASSGYGVPVHIWCGRSTWISPLASDQHKLSVLATIGHYFDACEQLGLAWLTLDRQKQRQITDRIEGARRRLRLYHSILMASSVDGPVSETTLSMAERLVAMRSAVPSLNGK